MEKLQPVVFEKIVFLVNGNRAVFHVLKFWPIAFTLQRNSLAKYLPSSFLNTKFIYWVIDEISPAGDFGEMLISISKVGENYLR